MNKILLLITGLVAAVTLVSCSSETVSGNGSNGSETTNGIIARVELPDGTPAGSISVRIRPSVYTMDTSSLQLAKKTVTNVNMDTTTGDDGSFEIDLPDTGSYRIVFSDNHTWGKTVDCAITSFDTLIDLETVHLDSMAPIRGLINNRNDTLTYYVLIPGMEKGIRIEPDESDTFKIDLVPQGTYAIHILTSDDGDEMHEVENVECDDDDEDLEFEFDSDSVFGEDVVEEITDETIPDEESSGLE